MKNLNVMAVVTLILVTVSATSLMAQNRHGRTSSARAAYGYPSQFSSKKKKKKQKKEKSPKRRGKSPAYRKQNPWVN